MRTYVNLEGFEVDAGSDTLITKRIPHAVIVRAPGLLPMLYKMNELAEELGVSSRLIREWTYGGMPHQHDARGHIWISGREFAAWVETQRNAKRGPKLEENEAYCLRCRQAVQLVEPVRQASGKRVLLQGACPQCGARINKGVQYGQSV